MNKRAVDLSVTELAAMGAKAAQAAIERAQSRGFVITGAVDMYENGQPVSSLAELHPSGVITLLERGTGSSIDEDAASETNKGQSRD